MYYENIPCSVFLSVSHLSSKCPFREKPALLPSPTPVIQEKTPSSQVTADLDKASVVSAKVIQSSKASPVPSPPEQLGSSDLICPIVVEETSNSNGNSFSPPTHSLSSPALLHLAFTQFMILYRITPFLPFPWTWLLKSLGKSMPYSRLL